MSEYGHWVIPEIEGAQHVPNADAVAGIVEALVAAGWIRMGPSSPYDSTLPFYYASFPGSSEIAQVRAGDSSFDLSVASEPVIRHSHCRNMTVMVTDTLLVAPTAEAQKANVACARCGKAQLPEAEPDKSRPVPADCPSCGSAVNIADFRGLPLFRFALVIELWFPQARRDLTADPQLLRLLRHHTGYSFEVAAQYPG